MKQLLRGHFLPTDYEQILYLQYQRCSQDSRSISAYKEKFYRLNTRVNLNESTQQLIARFIGGLCESIQDKLKLNSVWSLSQAINFTYKVELQINRAPRVNYYRKNTGDASSIIKNRRLSDQIILISLRLPQFQSRGVPLQTMLYKIRTVFNGIMSMLNQILLNAFFAFNLATSLMSAQIVVKPI